MIKSTNIKAKYFTVQSTKIKTKRGKNSNYLAEQMTYGQLNNAFNNTLSTTTRSLFLPAKKREEVFAPNVLSPSFSRLSSQSKSGFFQTSFSIFSLRSGESYGEKNEQEKINQSEKREAMEIAEKKNYLILPDLIINQDIKAIIKALNIDIGYFYSCYAFSVTLCCIMEQIRSRSLTTGKNLQEIQQFDSLRFYSKALASHLKPLLVAEIFSLNKLLPFLSAEESTPIKLKSIFNSLSIPDNKATIKMSRNTIMSSYTNKIAYGRGLFRSYIVKMQTTPIFSLQNLGKYNDITVSNLRNFIQGGEFVSIESITRSMNEIFHNNQIIFRDNINLNPNHNQNLVPLEESLNLKIIRKDNLINILHDIDLNEHEKNISAIERLRRQRIKKLNKSLFITEKN